MYGSCNALKNRSQCIDAFQFCDYDMEKCIYIEKIHTLNILHWNIDKEY